MLIGLWQDANNNNVIDTSIDTLLNSRANRPAITIISSNTGTKPGSFTLNVAAECGGSGPENTLSWTASPGAIGYYAVYRCTGSSCTPDLFWQNATAVPNTTFRNTAVTAGTPYTYFVRASNSFGYTDSNWATVITRSDCENIPNNSPVISSVIPNPNPPVNVGGTLSVTCSGSDPDGDALTYSWTSTGGNFSGSGSVVSWIAPSTAGTYTVTCSVSDGKGGSDSEGISISVISSTTVTPPVAPSNLTATAMGQNSIALTWQDNSGNEIGFNIERKTGTSGTFAPLPSAPAKSGSGSGVAYDDSGLTANTTYCYRVLAYNTAGASAYTTESCATTWAQLTNGSFTSGETGWTKWGDFWIGNSGVSPYDKYRTSPGYAAGGVDTYGQAKSPSTGGIYQYVSIPANATSATLSFWYNISSYESTSTANDYLLVTVVDSSGNSQIVVLLSNKDMGTLGVYKQITPFDVTSYKGQTIKIDFLSSTNNTLNTIFRIDDVSLMADGN